MKVSKMAAALLGRLTAPRPPLGPAVQAVGAVLVVLGVAVLAGLGWALLAAGGGLLVAGALIEAG